MRIVVALGGNALREKGEPFTFEHQAEKARRSMAFVADLVRRGHQVAITHGNGPQVGLEFFRQVYGAERFPVFPLDALGAMTQGWIGYALERGLREALDGVKLATIVSMVEVSPDDPAFQNPTKPIGDFFSAEEARRLREHFGWTFKEDPRGGWRVVVPSPMPKHILSAPAVKELLEKGFVVIAVGGGGIPVVKRENRYEGVFAVIDKDRASALLAHEVGADLFLILTGVPFVYVDFGKPTQRALRELTVAEAKELLEEGQFPPGSMGPKIEAAIWFLERGGKEVIITSLERAREALEGKAGTRLRAC